MPSPITGVWTRFALVTFDLSLIIFTVRGAMAFCHVVFHVEETGFEY